MTSSFNYNDLLEMLPVPGLICDSSGAVQFIGPEVMDLLGIPPLVENTERIKREAQVFFDDGAPAFVELLSTNGDKYQIPLNVIPVENGQFFCIFDESESRTFVTERFHAQRLQTLGMLAGGVAHDFNNMLAGILGHITYLKTILPAQGTHVESLAAIEDGARKASGLTQQILNFSKLSADEKSTEIHIGPFLERIAKLLRGALPPGIAIRCESESNLRVLAVEGKLAQVIVNLVINARDAIGNDGNISIRIRSNCTEEELLSAFEVRELFTAGYVAIEVEDDGCGMSAETISRIFEPYFSTKGIKGTGVGLSTVRDIIEKLGGAICFESQVGSGTCARVYLPVVHEVREIPRENSPEQKSDLEGGSERILIVDDEASVRNVIVMSLEHLGYQVVAVDNGMSAIDLVAREGHHFDLVILDMLMPKIPGESVFEKLREIDPELRVLLISGYSSEAAVQSVLEQGGMGFVQKPFTIEELATRVRQCLLAN